MSEPIKGMKKRILEGKQLFEAMTDEQRQEVENAMTRIRTGKTGYYHEIANLILDRDKLKETP